MENSFCIRSEPQIRGTHRPRTLWTTEISRKFPHFARSGNPRHNNPLETVQFARFAVRPHHHGSATASTRTKGDPPCLATSMWYPTKTDGPSRVKEALGQPQFTELRKRPPRQREQLPGTRSPNSSSMGRTAGFVSAAATETTRFRPEAELRNPENV